MTDIIDHLIAQQEYQVLKDRAAKLGFRVEENVYYLNVVEVISGEMPSMGFHNFDELRYFLSGVEFQRELDK